MKGFGCLLILISAGIIFLHTVIYASHNETVKKEHPIKTVLNGGKDLIPRYTFTAPLKPFEIFVYALGGIGIVLFIIGISKNDKKEQ